MIKKNVLARPDFCAGPVPLHFQIRSSTIVDRCM